ncbi:hypothetical protein [Aeromicrobium terrae]|uniref:Pentapeptide repeat-containing protein n=1 Tax=Aeromicrobium terrae TaxID=2498846 RepID=A0A5C8NPI2_9ACTN|nr:hypothetical protein [Aeromicrobium terrae]TXL62353.1 hypothetical protein FHP06_06590 [Aeromicrobium terrae]
MTGDRVILSGQRLVAADFSNRSLMQFSSEGCRFEECKFDRLVVKSASFGAGRATSEYIGCSFDHVKVTMGPGGYARFVDCTFEDADISNWFCFAVEIVNCTFSGRLTKAVFNGTVPAQERTDTRRTMNQFEGNDFARMKMRDVSFRTGIDLSRQKLPAGDEYTLIENARSMVLRARTAFNSWDDTEAKAQARGFLTVIEEDVADGQEQLLIRIHDYPRASRAAIHTLLAAAAKG